MSGGTQGSIRVIRVIRGSQGFCIFRITSSLISVLYFGERPEMTSHGGKPRKAKTMKGNNSYENKINEGNR